MFTIIVELVLDYLVLIRPRKNKGVLNYSMAAYFVPQNNNFQLKTVTFLSHYNQFGSADANF